MKKSTILAVTLTILLVGISNVYAAEVLGYPIVEKQARFYSIILGVIAGSIGLVSLFHFGFWVADLGKRAAQPVLRRQKESFADGLAAGSQAAK